MALRLAFTHPELVRRVIASGVELGPVTPEQQKAMQNLSVDRLPKAFREEYARVSPDVIFHSIPGAQICILPGTGHGPFLERPE
jgi:pimeloyl-ACP methyl ester carboxylesterase